ncbi:MAG TPA: hexose kinase, partial [Oscillospiraceae bacterium]|nr:hexose kinase [Oscillospiraceae bacterium]
AKVAKLLGYDVTATGFLGGDTGEFIENDLKGRGISAKFVKTKIPTRTCLNLNDTENIRQTVVLEPGSPVDELEQTQFIAVYGELLNKSDAVVLAGTVPQGVDANLIYPLLINMAKKAEKPVLIDTSGDALYTAISAKPDFIKPNRHELSFILKKDLSSIKEILEVALSLQKGGVKNVIVSMGEAGALFVLETGSYHAYAPPVKALNTVGCGDALVAGFMCEYFTKKDFIEAITKSIAVSAAAALSGEIGAFEKEDYESILPNIKIEKLL